MFAARKAGTMKFQSIALISIATLTSACSQLSDMGKMSDTTAHMSATTDHMASTTDGMAQTTDKMSQITGQMATTTDGMAQTTDGMAVTTNDVLSQTTDMYQDLRQANSLTIRNQTLDAMVAATSMQKKISEAGAYFMAFEFQLWKGDGRDTSDKMDSLYYCAMEEFTRILREYMPTDFSKVDATSQNSRMMDLYALAVSFHQVNPNAQPGALGMMDLVKQVLQLNQPVNSGKIAESSLKDWQREGLANYQELVYLMQIRSNFLAVMTLAQVSKIADSGFLGITGLARKLSMVETKWSSDFSKLNLEEIVTYTTWMNEADTDSVFLKSIGEPAAIDSRLKKIFMNMTIHDSTTDMGNSVRTTALTSFKSSFEAFSSIPN
jgi:hypothetical protein